MLRVPLHREFRYIHEPLPAGDPAIPPLGHERLVGALCERLAYSHGGAFLVSGFRGVGKSTLVLRALAATRDNWGDRDAMLVVHLIVARSMTTDQPLFAVVRRIFESLDDHDLLVRLPREVQRSLLLAYSRTSLSFTQTQSESSERGVTLGIASPARHPRRRLPAGRLRRALRRPGRLPRGVPDRQGPRVPGSQGLREAARRPPGRRPPHPRSRGPASRRRRPSASSPTATR